jgi:hypothetical protein
MLFSTRFTKYFRLFAIKTIKYSDGGEKYYTGQKKKDKRTNNDLRKHQTTTVELSPLKTGIELK